jgi:hypothetical protein
MHTLYTNRGPGSRMLMPVVLLTVISFVFVGCKTSKITPPPDQLWAAIQGCSGSWGSDVSTKLTAKYENLKKGGEVEWKAAIEAGGTLLKHFDDEANALKAYEEYLKCIKPAIDKFLSPYQRPTVVLIGSKEDYTTYQLPALEKTSVELLQRRLMNFRIIPLTVSYGWDNEESIRAEKPAVIVMHASAFHHHEYKDEAVRKFQALVSSLYGLPKTKFLVFSRLPKENPSSDLCQRWKRQTDFLSSEKFQDRLVFYPLPRDESNLTGKAGIEITQIVRCQSGLDATEYCSGYLSEIAQEAQHRIGNSSCNMESR